MVGSTSQPRRERTPIAIIGIGCRFPGGVDSPAEFWKLLTDKVDAIGPMPAGRFDLEQYYSPTPADPGKIITREGGFLNEIDRFDAAFFGISPREASAMDPQQRLLLEVAWEALEDAGLSAQRVAGSNTGVYIGMWTNEYEDKMYAASDNIDLYVTTGGGRYSASGRLSYMLDMHGPSLTVDTACSSSLVAIHLACQSLWSGETTQALAGAVNLILMPQISIGYSRSRMLSPDARCKFGDASANGYVRSEGAAAILLKPLDQAQADGDPIYAVILGSATNNDGHSSGLLVAPSGQGQTMMLRDAYQQAGVSPSTIQYVEAHGTGTAVGDPVELQALGTVLGDGRPADSPCIVGSVKTNIGHTEAASGMAGLIKAALSLKHRSIPASLHFETPNPNIPWAELPLRIAQVQTAWPEGAIARAGVNSFGVTGTNAHIVLQAAPIVVPNPPRHERQPLLLPISAHSPVALNALAHSYAELLAQTGTPSAHDICYTAAARRSHHEQRLAIVALDTAGLVAGLESFRLGEPHPGLRIGQATDAPNVVFVFPGQGSQWFGMARRLLANEPVFRDAIARCDAAIHAEAGWSLLEQLAADQASSRLNEIDVIQPTLFAIQVALAAQWRAWGIAPAAVVGHSMGEVAAAHVAGILSLEDAAAVICRRSRLLRRISGQGAMAAVELTIEQAQSAIIGYEDRLAIAVSNSPTSTVLSGDPAALDTVIEQLQQRDVFCRRVKVDVASHSPQVDPLRDDLLLALAKLHPQAASTPFFSTVTARYENGADCDARYWERNLCQPVLFANAVQQLLDDGNSVFLELSPHPILLPSIESTLHHGNRHGHVVPSLRRDSDETVTLLGSLGQLYTLGCVVDWAALHPQGAQVVQLPRYPWQRERFWYEPAATGMSRRPGHPLLGTPIVLAAQPQNHAWENLLNLQDIAFLGDHRVRGAAVLPAAGFLELALATKVDGEAVELEQFHFTEALGLPDDSARLVQLALAPHQSGSQSLQLFSRPAQDSATDWTLHAAGIIRRSATEIVQTGEPVEQILARCTNEQSAEEHYTEMRARGLEYGPAFQVVEQLWRTDGEVFGRLRAPASGGPLARYAERIALLDGALQLAVATLPAATAGATYMPIGVERLCLYDRPAAGSAVQGHAIRHDSRHTDDEAIYDVTLRDNNGRVLVRCEGMALHRLADNTSTMRDQWLYEVRWEQQERPATRANASINWLVLASDGLGEALARLLTAQGSHVMLVTPGTAYANLSPQHYAIDPTDSNGYRRLVAAASAASSGPLHVVHAWSATLPTDDINAAEKLGVGSALLLTQALIGAGIEARLWLISAGAQAAMPGDSVAPFGALLWGLGRTLANEHAELRPTLIDIEPGQVAALAAELLADGAVEQVALRGNQRLVARLAQHTIAPPSEPTLSVNPIYRLVAATPGMLDSLVAQESMRRVPGPGEIEIEIGAAGLNFIDVMKALGIYPGLEPSPDVALGGECAGTVVAVGQGVADFTPGDQVVALTPSFTRASCMASHLTLPAILAAHQPTQLGLEQAAGVPIVFLTAYYALHTLGRMRRGERVLIHAAAGGVGMAAVQLAQRAGAEIFATAGSPEKRALLRELGVQHVFDSRILDFADEIMAATNGRGVDLVLNSLAGAAIPRSLACLAPRGRFLEIGKRDIYENSLIGLEPFRRNLSFFAIDLASMIAESQQEVAEIFQEVMALITTGELRPIPTTAYPIGAATDAFRTMAQAQHIGKIVVVMRDQQVAARTADSLVRSDASYLITGGLGALGLAVAERLAMRGARHVALMGRSAPSTAAASAIARMEHDGVQLVVLRGDVAHEQDVAKALATIDIHMPPLRGVIHAAGLLDDATVAQLSTTQLHAALAPKLAGAWNLHRLTMGRQLDHFVLFSSVAALLGLPGQANYAAGNAFLDSLAQARRAAGLPALSIAWGPWSAIGLAAVDSNRGARLADRGLGSLTPLSALATLERLMSSTSTNVAVMPFAAQKWRTAYPSATTAALLYGLEQDSPASVERDVQISAALTAIEPGKRRRALFEAHLREQLAQVLRLPPARIDAGKPLKAMGLDSLMAIEFKNRLEQSLRLSLSATLAWNYPTITLLAEYLAGRMQIALDAPAIPLTSAPAEIAAPIDELADLTQDEVASLLDAELAALDELLKDG